MGCAAGSRDLFPTSLDLFGHTLEHTPATVIVDPYHNLVERDLDDDVKRL